MSDDLRLAVDEALQLAKLIHKDHRWYAHLITLYWKLAFTTTRIFEKYIPQKPDILHENAVLNFGCGNRIYAGIVNSDLFAPHRFFKHKKRPDFYWSGVTKLNYLDGCFSGVVCEHVIEHMLPDNALGLFSSFLGILGHDGVLVVSFPDINRVMGQGNSQGYSYPLISLNSVIYRHGHVFMYDKDIVSELLKQAGFNEVSSVTFAQSPLQSYLDPNRESETSYVVAKCSNRP